MAQFDLITLWRIGSGLADVWDAVAHPEHWPDWWPGLESAVELDRGGVDGIGNLHRFIWKGVLPYTLTTDIRTMRIEPLRLIQGAASGDVAGIGVWRFAARDGLTVVRHEWRVRITPRWLHVLSDLARPLVCWNHGKIMEWGAHGLARRLGADFCNVEKGASPV
ncbi:MAG: SRPBCC family protein [Acidobacteriota bacterium]